MILSLPETYNERAEWREEPGHAFLVRHAKLHEQSATTIGLVRDANS